MVVFSIAIGHEHEVQWDDEVHTLHSRFSDCTDSFVQYIHGLMHDLDAYDMVFAFSSPTNFRKEVLPTYKYNRKNSRKPLAYKRFKKYIENNFETYEYDQLEADDVLGILATNETYKNPIIVSDDKDLLSIPGRTYRLNELHTISLEEADKKHLMQTLTGDVADGYKGCPGIGEKRAAAILQDCRWDSVVAAYQGAGLTEEDALQQARVAKILRAEDWDTTKKEVILWQTT